MQSQVKQACSMWLPQKHHQPTASLYSDLPIPTPLSKEATNTMMATWNDTTTSCSEKSAELSQQSRFTAPWPPHIPTKLLYHVPAIYHTTAQVRKKE